jgi:acyl carrier protein
MPAFLRSRFYPVSAQYEIGFFVTRRPLEQDGFIRLRAEQQFRVGGKIMLERPNTMTREEFLLEMDEILGLRAGTLRGEEKLDELANWDSTALVGLIVLAETANDVRISPDQVIECSTVADLLRLAGVDGGPSQRSISSE